jgi:hypothetical protein
MVIDGRTSWARTADGSVSSRSASLTTDVSALLVKGTRRTSSYPYARPCTAVPVSARRFWLQPWITPDPDATLIVRIVNGSGLSGKPAICLAVSAVLDYVNADFRCRDGPAILPAVTMRATAPGLVLAYQAVNIRSTLGRARRS